MAWLCCLLVYSTSVKLSSWNGRVECEMSGSEQTRKTLMVASKRFSSSVNQGHAGGIRKVLQADGRSSMYKAMIV